MAIESELLKDIHGIVASSSARVAKAQRIAEAIRVAGDYRWVGLYDVTDTEVAIIAWSGAGPPAYPRFSVAKGLTGHAVSNRCTVVCNDVATDPRYLTAFGSTQSEIIVPIIRPATGVVVGTLDVERAQERLH